MSRIIRFRGKSLNDDSWVVGDLIHTSNGGMAIWPTKQNGGMIEVNPASVGQYTGLRDRKGVEIFEGDIVRQDYTATIELEDGDTFTERGYHIGVVAIRSKGAILNHCKRYTDADKYVGNTSNKSVSGYRAKIIGNIIENPEKITYNN